MAGDRGDIGPMAFLGDVFGMDLLFNWDNSTSTDGVRGLEVIRLNPDGSLTGLGVFNPGVSMGNVGDVAVWRGIPEPTSLAGVAAVGGLLLLRRRK